jgi:hypothetical protein
MNKKENFPFNEREIKKLKQIIYGDSFDFDKFGSQITNDLKTVIIELKKQKSSDCFKFLSFFINCTFGIMIGVIISIFFKPYEFLK